MPTMTSLEMKMPALLSQPLKMLIDGEWVSSQSGARMDVINPSNGQVLVQESLGGAHEVDLAVQAARRAFESGPWSRMRPAERTRLLLKLAEALEHNVRLRTAELADGHLCVLRGDRRDLTGDRHPAQQDKRLQPQPVAAFGAEFGQICCVVHGFD